MAGMRRTLVRAGCRTRMAERARSLATLPMPKAPWPGQDRSEYVLWTIYMSVAACIRSRCKMKTTFRLPARLYACTVDPSVRVAAAYIQSPSPTPRRIAEPRTKTETDLQTQRSSSAGYRVLKSHNVRPRYAARTCMRSLFRSARCVMGQYFPLRRLARLAYFLGREIGSLEDNRGICTARAVPHEKSPTRCARTLEFCVENLLALSSPHLLHR